MGNVVKCLKMWLNSNPRELHLRPHLAHHSLRPPSLAHPDCLTLLSASPQPHVHHSPFASPPTQHLARQPLCTTTLPTIVVATLRSIAPAMSPLHLCRTFASPVTNHRTFEDSHRPSSQGSHLLYLQTRAQEW